MPGAGEQLKWNSNEWTEFDRAIVPKGDCLIKDWEVGEKGHVEKRGGGGGGGGKRS